MFLFFSLLQFLCKFGILREVGSMDKSKFSLNFLFFIYQCMTDLLGDCSLCVQIYAKCFYLIHFEYRALISKCRQRNGSYGQTDGSVVLILFSPAGP